MDEFVATVVQELENGDLQLPTLPEVALRVREAVESPDSTANEVAEVMSQDAALTARLLQVANSAMYRGRVEITSLQMAISRLGNTLVRDLVAAQAMKQMFQATNDEVDSHLRDSWEHSVRVAGIARALAAHCPGVSPDEAMLAGLLHDVGTLPILYYAEEHNEVLQVAGVLDHLIDELHGQIGAEVMRRWNFPESLVAVVAEHENLARDHEGPPDLVDVVQVANLQSRAGLDDGDEQPNWMEVPAFRRLGFGDDVEEIELAGIAETVDEVKNLFE